MKMTLNLLKISLFSCLFLLANSSFGQWCGTPNPDFCPGNQFDNGNFETVTDDPSVLTSNDINLAVGWSEIWQAGSLADLFCEGTSPGMTPPTPLSGNFGGMWISNTDELTSATWREGMFNQLLTPIASSSGSYTFGFDVANLQPGNTAGVEIGIYGINYDPSTPLPASPTGSHYPDNSNLFGPANSVELGVIPVTGSWSNTWAPQTLTFNSGMAGFPAAGITHIMITHSELKTTGVQKRYMGFDNFCLQSDCVKQPTTQTFSVIIDSPDPSPSLDRDDRGFSGIEDSNGNEFCIAGESYGYNAQDVFVNKLNAAGNLTTSMICEAPAPAGAISNEGARWMNEILIPSANVPNGGYVYTGVVGDSPNRNMFIKATDKTGVVAYAQIFDPANTGEEIGNCVIQDSQGHFVAAGTKNGQFGSTLYAAGLGTNFFPNKWVMEYMVTGSDVGWSVTEIPGLQGSSGGPVYGITGRSDTRVVLLLVNANDGSPYLPQGAILYDLDNNPNTSEVGYSITTDYAGNVLIAGGANRLGSGPVALNSTEIFILKISIANLQNSPGVPVGALSSLLFYDVQDSDNEWARHISVTEENSYILTGKHDVPQAVIFGADEGEAFLLSVQDNGAVNWINTYTDPDYEGSEGRRVEPVASGGYFMTGSIWDHLDADGDGLNETYYNQFAVRTDPLGVLSNCDCCAPIQVVVLDGYTQPQYTLETIQPEEMPDVWNIFETTEVDALQEDCDLDVPPSGCSSVCDAFASLNVSTGVDASGTQLPCTVGSVDPFWRLINNPPIEPCTNPLIGTINGSAFVMSHDNLGGNIWANQTGVGTLAPVDGSCDTNFGCNNLQNSAGQYLPYIFERTFCMCDEDSIRMSLGVEGDDQVFLELWDISNSTLLTTSPTYNFTNGTTPIWNYSTTLPIGTYALRANLANTNSTVLGFSISGSIVSFSGQQTVINDTICCENNTVNVRKILDYDCDGTVSMGDQVGAGWDFDLYDSAGGLVQSGTTNLNGELFFNNVLAGTYTIIETPQSGWFPGTPSTGQTTITVSPGSFNVVDFYNCPDDIPTCDDLEINLVPNSISNTECCYQIDIANNYGNTIIGLEAEILTPGWIFNTVNINGGIGWNGIPSSTNIEVSHNSGSFPLGATPNLLDFCLANTVSTAANPQQIEFTWYELVGNDTIAVCDTILLTDCFPVDIDPPCAEIEVIDVECDSLKDVYKMTFTVTNNHPTSAATNIMLSGASGYLFGSNPGGPYTTNIILPVSIPPMGTSGPICVYIYSTSPVTSPSNICFNYGIWGQDFCCHSPDPVCVTLEPCCLITSNISLVCDSNKYLLTFDVTNKSSLSPAATALVVTVKNPVASGITLTPTGGFFDWSASPLPYNSTRTVTTCVEPFPISDPDLILGYVLHHGPFPFQQDSCCISTVCDTIPIPTCDPCCDDYDQFCDQVDAGYTYTLNPTDCEIRVLPNALDSCQYVIWDWGDGTTTGPVSAVSGPFTHVYSGSGGYAVCMTVYEQDADGNICWEKQFCDQFSITCDGCCSDYQAFCDRVDPGFLFSIPSASNNCTMNVGINSLTDCDRVTWDWGDGTTTGPLPGTSASTSHVYTSGSYTVCMIVEEVNAAGEVCWVKEVCYDVIADCDPTGCCSNYQAFCDRVDTGFAIAFNDPTTCTIGVSPLGLNQCDRVIWNWGDGSTSGGTWNTSNTHTYAASGVYTVCMIVQEVGADGTVCWEKEHCIEVEVICDGCCSSYQAFCDRVDTGFIIAFNDPNNCTVGVSPSALSQCDQVAWDWGDGTSSTGTWNTSNTHTYAAPGNYTICMLVREVGADGTVCWEKEHCIDVVVECPPPPCCTDYQAFCDRVDAGYTIGFNNPNNCSIGVSPNGLNECDQVTWSWGDGTTSPGSWNTGVPHTYAAPGVYTVCMIVQEIGADGNVCWEKEYCSTIEVQCDGCCSSYQAFCDRVDAGFLLGISTPNNCAITVAPIALNDCDWVTWVWGDGTSTGPLQGPSAGATHTYPGPGTYTVCMIVRELDAAGNPCWEKEYCSTIQVQCDPVECCVDYDLFCNQVDVGFTPTLSGKTLNATPNALTNCHRVTWDWGDGSPNDFSTGSASVSHTYANAGIYWVCMIVIEENPLTGVVCWQKEYCRKIAILDVECPPVIVIGPVAIPSGVYHAAEAVNARGNVISETGQEGGVNFKAGEIILLDNGFSTSGNTNFSAEIEDCNDAFPCWDINQNGACDQQEDTNGNGTCDNSDCAVIGDGN